PPCADQPHETGRNQDERSYQAQYSFTPSHVFPSLDPCGTRGRALPLVRHSDVSPHRERDRHDRGDIDRDVSTCPCPTVPENTLPSPDDARVQRRMRSEPAGRPMIRLGSAVIIELTARRDHLGGGDLIDLDPLVFELAHFGVRRTV